MSLPEFIAVVVGVFVSGTGQGMNLAHPTIRFAPDTIASRTVALLPSSTASGVPNPIIGRHVMDSLIGVSLTNAGFNVLPPEVVEPVWRRVVDSVHGYFDPATGRPISEKLRDVRAAVAREVGASALVQARVGVVMLSYKRNEAVEYGGVSEVVAGGSSGAVGALLLAITVSDSSGTVIHCGVGGIQLLAKGTFWNNQAHPVKPEQIFADTARNGAAVHRALGGFLRHEPACFPKPDA
jgi:hypothetical protein